MFKRLRLLFGYMRGNRLLYIGAIICVGISALIAMIPTLIIRFAVDSVIGSQPAELPRALHDLIDRMGGVEFLRNNLDTGPMFDRNIPGQFAFAYLRGKWSAMAAESTAKG